MKLNICLPLLGYFLLLKNMCFKGDFSSVLEGLMTDIADSFVGWGESERFCNKKSRLQRLSQCVRIVASILWNPTFLTLFCTFGYFLAIYLYFLALLRTFIALFVFKKIMFDMSCYACHLPPVTNTNSHRPSPADSPIIHSRLVPDPKKP